jgi:hypothetical protein
LQCGFSSGISANGTLDGSANRSHTGPAPKSKVLVAIIPDKEDRMQRVLSGHDVTFVKDCNEARTLLEDEEYALVVLGVPFAAGMLFRYLT